MITIRPAKLEEAPVVGSAVCMALLDHGIEHFVEETNRRRTEDPQSASLGTCTAEDVKALFGALAAREDSQYSYRNALVAEDEQGRILGAIVGYDGALLEQLRRVFVEESRRRLGVEFNPADMGDETSPDEFYLDSLAVFPGSRGKGVGGKLLLALAERAHAAGKPAGLLCDKENVRAEALYTRLGFRYVGDRPFAGMLMRHLQLPPK